MQMNNAHAHMQVTQYRVMFGYNSQEKSSIQNANFRKKLPLKALKTILKKASMTLGVVQSFSCKLRISRPKGNIGNKRVTKQNVVLVVSLFQKNK